MNELAERLQVQRRSLEQQRGQAQALLERGKALQSEIVALKNEVDTFEKVSLLLNSIGETRQNEAQSLIESLVTLGLQEIFGAELSFHLVQSTSGKSVVVDFMVRTTLADGTFIDTALMDARGGGLVATVGFLLRLVIMLLMKPKNKLLILDETFAMVSAGYIDRVGSFLRKMVDTTDVQIILVTHQESLTECADVLYSFKLDDQGHTSAKKLDVVGTSM